MNIDKRQRNGFIIGILVWAIIEIMFSFIQDVSFGDVIIVGMMILGAIIVIVYINVKYNVKTKAKIIFSTLLLATCIFNGASILIIDSSNQNIKSFYQAINILSFICLFALIIYISILYIRAKNKNQ